MSVEQRYRKLVENFDSGYRHAMESDYVAGVTYQDIKSLIKEIDTLRENVNVAKDALEPFAKSGELFNRVGYLEDQLIYNPAAGLDYSISAKNLVKAKWIYDSLKIIQGKDDD